MSSAQILIVEDERLIARCMKSELEGMGYAVPAIAASGEEALAKFNETKPDLVLMDIVLKGSLDGIETARRLHAFSHVPVVYLSAHRDPELVERAKATEPFGFLMKPYEGNELRTTIEMALHRHHLEERFHDTQKWLHGTLSALHDAVIATDILQRVGYMNPAAERLTGWSAAEAQDCDLERVLHVQCGDEASAVAVTERATMETGGPAPLPAQARLVARDGAQIPVEGTCTPLANGDGFYTGFVWTLRDASRQAAAEEALRLREAQLEARQQPQALQQLTGTLAHEFNNLLTMVLGNSSLVLCNLPEHDPNLQALLNIHAAASRAMNLVQRAQGRARRHHALGLVEVDTPLRKVCETLPHLISAAITLDYRPGQDLWPIHSTTDLVEELAINLCLSACETMPRGGQLVLETENVTLADDDLLFHHDGRAGDFVRVRVCDNGEGLSSVLRTRLFEREPPAQESECGLDSVREIVHDHHGWIECFSAPGQGTRLDIYVPRAQGVRPNPRTAPAPSRPQPARKTVLLVDDEKMLRELGRNILALEGYDVIVAEDGHEALKTFAAEKDRIGVVILDLTMPRLSGDETFKEMLRLDPDVRVLFCSGYPEDHVKSLHHRQVCGFIMKPYRNEELLAAVRSALGRQQSC